MASLGINRPKGSVGNAPELHKEALVYESVHASPSELDDGGDGPAETALEEAGADGLGARRHSHARNRGDIELLELTAKDPQAFILKQGWASVSLDAERGLLRKQWNWRARCRFDD